MEDMALNVGLCGRSRGGEGGTEGGWRKVGRGGGTVSLIALYRRLAPGWENEAIHRVAWLWLWL